MDISMVEKGRGDKPKEHTLAVHNCSYTVQVKTKACCGRSKSKTILKNINAIFKPGMNAILGPTGSGKSSLLDVLAGRKESQGLSGCLLIDGAPPPDNFKCMVGYVVQDDVVMGTLTIKENLTFSASLRLPADTSSSERERRVDSVIEELGLTKCANTKVGNDFIRGVSGGERKRCNIGMELIISPPVLFLDEPTTGLDASTANSVMYLLRRMAQNGQTIIFSIHQPRFSIFKVFDSMVLLSAGETVYHGPASQALDYFKSVGYECEEHNNPSDFFLDVIQGDYDEEKGLGQHKLSNGISNDDTKSIEDNHLAEKFRASQLHTKMMGELTPIHDQYQKNLQDKTVVRLPRVQYATSFFTQLFLLAGRTVKNLIRNPQSSILQVFVSIFFATIVGVIYLQLSDTANPDVQIQDRTGAFFFIIMNQMFSNLSAVELFIRERAIFMHENVSGFYRVSAFFLSKVFCDVIPMRLIPVFIFSCIAYWMIGFKNDPGAFFFFFILLFMIALTGTSLAFCISASVRIYAIANLLIAMIFVLMMLFGGFLKNLESMPDWLNWIKYLSIFKYGVDGLYINELEDQVYCNTGGNCTHGNDVLMKLGIEHGEVWYHWRPVVALACMTVIFMSLCYIQLLRIKKLR